MKFSEKQDIAQIAEFFKQQIGPKAIATLNSEFCRMQLIKQTNDLEPLPTAKRQLSSYRTRLGTMMEYALSTIMFKLLQRQVSEELLFTFAVAHEYPDFILRGAVDLKPLVRIEMKAVDADSDEHAARFEALQSSIVAHKDLLLLIGWKWSVVTSNGREYGMCPEVFDFLFVPAIEIARERDRRLVEAGGKIENGEIFVPKRGSPHVFVEDPGNFGKLHRIVHTTRRDDISKLSPGVRELLTFIENVERQSVGLPTKK